jgi:hypothetical protein
MSEPDRMYIAASNTFMFRQRQGVLSSLYTV